MRLAQLAEPLVKLLPPEIAHRLAINGMKIAPPAPAVPRDPRLIVAALGLKFPNPLGLAAGFDKGRSALPWGPVCRAGAPQPCQAGARANIRLMFQAMVRRARH